MEKDKKEISPAVIHRMPRYFRYLRDLLNKDILRISSDHLAKLMNVTPSQVRQDFCTLGEFGQQGYGYNVKVLYNNISDILGVHSKYTAVLLGFDDLGKSLISSPLFAKRGITLKAIFTSCDSDSPKSIDNIPLFSHEEIESFCAGNPIDIAVLTVPFTEAEPSIRKLKKYGLKGIWNFSAEDTNPQEKDLLWENVHLGDSLMNLTYQIQQKERTEKKLKTGGSPV